MSHKHCDFAVQVIINKEMNFPIYWRLIFCFCSFCISQLFSDFRDFHMSCVSPPHIELPHDYLSAILKHSQCEHWVGEINAILYSRGRGYGYVHVPACVYDTLMLTTNGTRLCAENKMANEYLPYEKTFFLLRYLCDFIIERVLNWTKKQDCDLRSILQINKFSVGKWINIFQHSLGRALWNENNSFINPWLKSRVNFVTEPFGLDWSMASTCWKNHLEIYVSKSVSYDLIIVTHSPEIEKIYGKKVRCTHAGNLHFYIQGTLVNFQV